MMEEGRIRRIVEAALLAADGPLTVANLTGLFGPGELNEENPNGQIRDILKALEEDAQERGVELKRVASGYRYQVRQELSQWVSRLWDEKPPRYTRALLETLALVAYKQPVTRGDIEEVRGVSVSQNIMRTLLERDWIRVVGQREAPGRPSLYGTTKAFLDYFNLRSLDELPPLAEIRELLEPAVDEAVAAGAAPGEGAQPAAEATAQASDEAAQQNEASAGDAAITPQVTMPGEEAEPIADAAESTDDDQAAADAESVSAEIVPLHSSNSPASN